MNQKPSELNRKNKQGKKIGDGGFFPGQNKLSSLLFWVATVCGVSPLDSFNTYWWFPVIQITWRPGVGWESNVTLIIRTKNSWGPVHTCMSITWLIWLHSAYLALNALQLNVWTVSLGKCNLWDDAWWYECYVSGGLICDGTQTDQRPGRSSLPVTSGSYQDVPSYSSVRLLTCFFQVDSFILSCSYATGEDVCIRKLVM